MKLTVCLEGEIAGELEGDGSHASFAYSQEWLSGEGAYPLSHSMPLDTPAYTGRTVLNFLWGLLPDNPRTLDTWAKWFQISPRNPLALLMHVGEDCAGAVQFVTAERLPQVLKSAKAAPSIAWLEERELEARIHQLVRDGAAGRTPEEGQFSLAGAQTKTALHFDATRGLWGVPNGRTPTTHILKPVANDFDGFAENEHFCLALTRRLGLAAARTEWQPIGGIPTLVVERYDRVQLDGRWHRIHQEDCCQALGIHPDSKYENEGGPGFADIMSLLMSADDPQVDRGRLMMAACLDYLLAATDAHGKNFSLLHGRGDRRPSLRLAPFYDIASAWPYLRRLPVQKRKMAMRIGGHYRLREILPRHFHKLALACNYPPDALVTMLLSLCDRLPDEAASLGKDVTTKGMDRPVLDKLVDGVTSQCQAVKRHMTALTKDSLPS
jgi:serine/threonine-protein kinase HipA